MSWIGFKLLKQKPIFIAPGIEGYSEQSPALVQCLCKHQFWTDIPGVISYVQGHNKYIAQPKYTCPKCGTRADYLLGTINL